MATQQSSISGVLTLSVSKTITQITGCDIGVDGAKLIKEELRTNTTLTELITGAMGQHKNTSSQLGVKVRNTCTLLIKLEMKELKLLVKF